MSHKIRNMKKAIYELYARSLGITNVLGGAAFGDLEKPAMLATAGRFMTIPTGAAMKKASL